MAALKLLLSQARRHCLSKPSFPHRSLCSSSSSSNPNLNSESPAKPSQTVPIQPVSYTVKPKDPSTPDQSPTPSPPPPFPPRQQPRNPQQQETPSLWTREDVRYVKDVPNISPVSYPSRVAPLPEDKISADGEGANKEQRLESNEEMKRERRRIEAEGIMRRRVFRVSEEENVAVPFPMLIKKKESKEKPAPLDLVEAIRLVKASATKNFDETIEAHVRLAIKKERTDQDRGMRSKAVIVWHSGKLGMLLWLRKEKEKNKIVHGSLILPHGVAKVVRVAFFAEGADADEARAAGADIVGGVELIEEIASSNKFNVDKCFATPQLVLRLNKIASFLKERHLLPDRKSGTVTSDVSGAIKAARLGRIHFKMDKTSIVHVGLGKASFAEESLRENIGAFMNALLIAKPASLKKASKYAGYVNSFHICSTAEVCRKSEL
uniref:CL1 n=1 Tax=Quercus lobata TaxID=97700 RepID=A0A7N2MD91_QUELO